MWREVFVCAAVGMFAGMVPERGTRVAVVEMQRVLTEGKPFQADDRALREWIAAQKATFKQRQAEVDAKKKEQDLYSKGSREHAALELAIAKLALELDYEIAEADRTREERVIDHQRKAFDTATRAIQEVAKTREIELVMQLRSGPLVARTQSELSSEIFLREVLAADSALDITADVLKVIDR